MISSGPSKYRPEDNAVIYTGMYLRPHDASSLQRIMKDQKFMVSKSQIHPNGYCEIVVKRTDPKMSASSIMEILRQSRELVKSTDIRLDSNLNQTIELSDDDSVCVVPSSPFSQRSVKIMNSPLSQSLRVAVNNFGSADINFNSPRMISLKRTVSDGSKNIVESSVGPLSKRSTRGEILYDSKASITPLSNDATPVAVLHVSEDTLPSAPTWTSSEPSKFPLSNVSRILGAKGSEDIACQPSSLKPGSLNNATELEKAKSEVATSNVSWAKSSIFPISNINKILGAKELDGKKAQCPSSSKTCNANRTVEVVMLDCKSGFKGNSEISEAPYGNRVNALSNPSISDVSIEILDDEPMCQDEVRSGVSTKMGSLPNSDSNRSVDGNPVTVNTVGSSSDSSSDDEIIIEKEVKIVSRPMLRHENQRKKRQLQRKMKREMNAMLSRTTSVCSMSNQPTPDFIPLHSAVEANQPKATNHPLKQPLPDFIPLHSSRKNSQSYAQKLLIVKDKKRKKERALRSQSVRAADAASTTSSGEDKKKKHEFDGNVMNPNSGEPKTGLRPIVIDGSNVAIGHGKGPFSVAGLKICIKYFTDKGHKVHAFVPKFRRFHVSPDDRKVLDELEKLGSVSFTPSRTMEDGRKVASYDDRFIVQTAAELGGIVVSTDNYRDLLAENESWRETVEQRLLMFTWVGDMLIFPNDPLGRNGPHLQEFLRFPDPPKK